MNLKDPVSGKSREGGKLDKKYSPRNRDEAEHYLECFFRNEEGHDLDAIKYIEGELKKMLKYFQEENMHEIHGMSILIVIDSAKKSYVCKLIDLVDLQPNKYFAESNSGPIKRDQGVIKGIKSILRILDCIRDGDF